MHCDMLKIQDGVAIVEKLNWKFCRKIKTISYPSSVLTLSIAVTIIVILSLILRNCQKLPTE